MKNLKWTILVGVIGFVLGGLFQPKEVEVREVEKIVYKEQITKKSNIKRDVNKRETIKPDGTKVIETVTSTSRDSQSDSNISSEQEKSKSTKVNNNWHISVLYSPSIMGIQDQTYALDIQRRILGNLFLGASASTQKQIGVSIGLEF
jgi:hypothetical protein